DRAYMLKLLLDSCGIHSQFHDLALVPVAQGAICGHRTLNGRMARIQLIKGIVRPSRDHAQTIPSPGRMSLGLLLEQLLCLEVIVYLQRRKGLVQWTGESTCTQHTQREHHLPSPH